MNYKLEKDFEKFSVYDVTTEKLIRFFSLNKFSAAYFFENDEFCGWLSLNMFLDCGCEFDKKCLNKTYIKDYQGYIKSHKEIVSFFRENPKVHSVLVQQNGKYVGEFSLIDRHRYSFETQKKIDALNKLKCYEQEVKEYFDFYNYKKIGIIVPDYLEHKVPDFMEVCQYGSNENYDIVLDGFLINEFSDGCVDVDDVLACALLLNISRTTNNMKNIWFIDEPNLSEYDLYEDEKVQLSYVKNLKAALNNREYIHKCYKDYPKDLEYLDYLGTDVYHSVTIENNGVFRFVSASKIKDDFLKYRITPSNSGNKAKIYFYGPCVCYSIFTSSHSTIEENLQQMFNDEEIQFDVVNCGVPNGRNILNDILRMIYQDYEAESYHLFINRIGAYVKSFLKKICANYMTLTQAFYGEHYWCFNENMHLTPKGTFLAAKAIMQNINFNPNGLITEKVINLRREKPNSRYYLIENNLNAYIDYLYRHKTNINGIIGFLHVNASPLTNGHAYLIDYAVKNCDFLYVFITEDNINALPFHDRFSMLKEYCSKYSNVIVLSGSDFIGSKYTLSAYYNKRYDMEITPEKDVQNFHEIINPVLEIDVRFMGTEPNSKLTYKINSAYKKYMQKEGKKLIEIPRLEADGCVVSASDVRRYLKIKDYDSIEKIVPTHVLEYLKELDFDEFTDG